MATSFAPYQDTDPSTERARSPPPQNVRSSYEPVGRPHANRSISEVTDPYLPSPDDFAREEAAYPVSQLNLRQRNLEAFQSSLPMRLDYEAVLAYVLLPPAGGVLLLLLEHKSDYVRFHAWQSSITFSLVFILHLIVSASKALSWILFVLDVLLIGLLASRAYRDVDTLEHFEIPVIGRIANRFVDDE